MHETKRLLIVEDDVITSVLYSKILSDHFELVICNSVNEFFENLNNGSYDLFIVDISLKNVKNGISLIKEIKKEPENKDKPIVVITASIYVNDLKNAMDSGATLLLRKPIEYKSLISELKRLLQVGDIESSDQACEDK